MVCLLSVIFSVTQQNFASRLSENRKQTPLTQHPAHTPVHFVMFFWPAPILDLHNCVCVCVCPNICWYKWCTWTPDLLHIYTNASFPAYIFPKVYSVISVCVCVCEGEHACVDLCLSMLIKPKDKVVSLLCWFRLKAKFSNILPGSLSPSIYIFPSVPLFSHRPLKGRICLPI